MGTGRGKNKQELTKREGQTNTAIEQWKPTELENLQNKTALTFMQDWNSGKDVKDIEGLRGYYNLFQNGANKQNQEKLGAGIMGATAQNSGAMATAQTAQNNARDLQFRQGLLMGASEKASEFYNGVLAPSLTGMAENRNANRAQFFSQREDPYRQLANRPNKWLAFLKEGMQKAGQSMATGGMG